ncbi:MAG: hypothetical protein WAU01_17245 [Saprospiraceae bacterium]
MFIVVESGSTKADWVIVHPSGNHQLIKTEGINPSTQAVFFDIITNPELQDALCKSEALYFYGAGVVESASKQRILVWLSDAGFSGHLETASDMLAAARACCGDQPGIVCILGTGSNSCVYDGRQSVKSIPSLGYILSDEGGGVHFGKEIIKAYFYQTMPPVELEIFKHNFHLTREDVIENVYKNQKGSKYIASFAKFLTFIEGEWKEALIEKIFTEFVEVKILPYEERKRYNIHFAGSMAFHYQNTLFKILDRYHLKAGKIIHQPIHQLIEYHKKKISYE